MFLYGLLAILILLFTSCCLAPPNWVSEWVSRTDWVASKENISQNIDCQSVSLSQTAKKAGWHMLDYSDWQECDCMLQRKASRCILFYILWMLRNHLLDEIANLIIQTKLFLFQLLSRLDCIWMAHLLYILCSNLLSHSPFCFFVLLLLLLLFCCFYSTYFDLLNNPQHDMTLYTLIWYT